MHPLALMFAALLITLAWAPAAAASEPATVASIVAASGTALGTGALARAHGLDISGTIEVLGIKGTARTWQDLRDGNFATSTVAGPLSGDNGYDGSNVWNRDRYGVVFDDGSRAAAYGAVQAAYVGRYALWQPKYGGATVSLGAPQTLAGKSYDVLTITPKDGLPFDYWFDAATHLPFRTVVPISIITTTTTFADYRSFQGVQIATAQKQESVQGVSSFAVTDVRFDEPGFSKNLEHPHSTVSGFSIVGGAEATVPFELVDNHVYIDVSINGQGPYRFIFDTGGSLVIDTELAKKLGLNRAGSMQGIGVGENTDTFNFATIDSLSIGNATIGHLDGAIAPVRNGFSASGGEPVDGLIGSETLARFVTTFDYPNRRLTFRMPGAPPVAGGVTTPFVFSGTDPMLPCRIGSVDGTCTVDTGSRNALDLYSPFAKANSGAVTGLTAPGIDGFGVGGPEVGRLGRTSLRIGGYDVPNVIAGLSSSEKGAFADPYTSANVGGAVWRRFAVTFDYPNRTMTLVPGKDFASAEDFDRSGLFLIMQSGHVVVAGARAGTPAAAAGIVPGDALASIDGTPAATLSLKAVRDLLMQAPGTTHRLVVISKDKSQRTVALTLRDYV
jgi:predicted aspartyl protease